MKINIKSVTVRIFFSCSYCLTDKQTIIIIISDYEHFPTTVRPEQLDSDFDTGIINKQRWEILLTALTLFIASKRHFFNNFFCYQYFDGIYAALCYELRFIRSPSYERMLSSRHTNHTLHPKLSDGYLSYKHNFSYPCSLPLARSKDLVVEEFVLDISS